MIKPAFTSVIAALMLMGPAASTQAGEPLSIEYTFDGNTSVSLASIAGGPLTINAFTDGRSAISEQDISRGADNEPLTLTNQTAAALVQSSFASVLEKAGAKLGESGSPIVLDGKLIEMSVQDKGNGFEVLIRCELTLRNQGRNAWQSTVLSRVETENKNPAEAVEQGLDRLVAGLFRDDYFLMELGIF